MLQPRLPHGQRAAKALNSFRSNNASENFNNFRSQLTDNFRSFVIIHIGPIHCLTLCRCFGVQMSTRSGANVHICDELRRLADTEARRQLRSAS